MVTHKFHGILKDSHSCDDRTFLFEIDAVEAIEMAVAQHSGIKEALSIPDLNVYGTGPHYLLDHIFQEPVMSPIFKQTILKP